MQLIAGAAGRAFGHELRTHTAGLRVERRAIEIDDTIEYTRRADEFVEPFALVVLFGESMRGARATERGRDCCANHFHAWNARAYAADDFAHARLHRFERCVAVLAEVVNAFEPDHSLDARQAQHIAFEALTCCRPARKRFLRGVFGRANDLVAA